MKNTYAIIIIIAVLGIAGVVFLSQGQVAGPNVPEGEQIACTMDALICPDGSGVGRSGPKCEFQACPNQESFTGMLVQTEEGFVLTVPGPYQEIIGHETYTMPLKFSRISNALADFVGEEVIVKGAFTSGSTLEVDFIEKVSANDRNSAELKIGESKTVNGVRITVNKLVEESRCPIDAVCIQAGKFIANVTLKSDTDTETLNMTEGASATLIDTFKVSLVSAKPLPMASKPTLESDYRLLFKVESN